MGVLAVESECRLAIGACLDQPVTVPVGEQLAQALGGDAAAAVLEGVSRMSSVSSATRPSRSAAV